DQELVELEVVVAQAARNRRAARKILFNKRPHHLAFEALLLIYHVIRNPDAFSHAARIVDVVEGAAAPSDLLRHSPVTRQSALVPQLHGQADNVVSFGTQHGRDGGG